MGTTKWSRMLPAQLISILMIPCLFSCAVSVLGEFMHPCEDDIVCKCTTEENKVPYFNAPVYLENKEQIGKVDEIFGQLRDFVSFLMG